MGIIFLENYFFSNFWQKYLRKFSISIKFKTKRNPADYSGATICPGKLINCLIAP
jgi:hypothetical protein